MGYESINEFIEEKLGNDETEFTFEEAMEVASDLGYSIATPVIREMKEYGFTMQERMPERRIRGINTNNHDRWTAYQSHGGSGWQQISGFAGDVG